MKARMNLEIHFHEQDRVSVLLESTGALTRKSVG